MGDDVLFAVKEEHLETGLRGVPVGYCTTSFVDPINGLFYVGKPIANLCHLTPIEVIYLLYSGQEGDRQAVGAFELEIAKRAAVSCRVLEGIEKLPREGHPMQLFISAVMIASMFELKGDYREDCLNLIAKIPTLVATLINHHANWGKTPPSRPELGYMENFCQMLRAPGLNPQAFLPVMNLFHILHLDHGGGNLSTFVGKAVASSLEDLYGSIASSLCALAGPRHGRANQDCLESVWLILTELGSEATEAQVEQLLRERLSNKELIFGFGHAVLRVEDPRATVQYAFCDKHYPNHPLVKVAKALRTAGTKVLKENPKITNPYPNVDAISGTLLTASGFGYPQYFTVLFGLARAVGIAIQIVYERTEARGGKGTPIFRPKYLYRKRG